MTRRQPHSAFAAALLLVIVANLRAADRPNVVVILTDDQGWGDLSLNGNTNLATPNVDSLAADGASFDRFFVCAVCSPTRAEFLTGRYHPRCGVYSTSTGGERIDLDESTIAEAFQSAGYATAAFGKWHNGMQPPYHPNARGFDNYYGFCSGHWGHYFSPMLEHNGQIVQGDGYIIDDFTGRALTFIEEHQDDPFFVYLPFNTPHSPMQVPERWWEKFADNPLELHHREPDREKLSHVRAALAMCENIDWNVGRILDRLDDLNLAENTIVVYFCDNGPNGFRWNGDMKGRKGSTDEGGVRSPLLIRWPGHIPAGRKIEPIAAAIDLLPTLTDLAGIERTGSLPLDGQSLHPVLNGDGDELTDRIIFSHWAGRVSARTQRFRLDHQGQLFDMPADPGQRTNVAAQHPDVTTRLTAAVDAWKQELLPGLKDDDRPFPVGHPGYAFTQLPARDAVPHGGLERSSRHPNCSFITNWTSTEDHITWDADVLAAGEYHVDLFYTCRPEDIGCVMELSCSDHRISSQITEAHDPPLVGAEEDHDQRTESLVKEFKPHRLGTLRLEPGRRFLTLRATEIPGDTAIDFRLMMLTRAEEAATD